MVGFFGSSRRLNLVLLLSVDRVATYLRERRLPGESGSAEVVEFREAVFEFRCCIHLMHTNTHSAAGLDLGLLAQDEQGLSWKRL